MSTDITYYDRISNVEQPTEAEYEQMRGDISTVRVARCQKKKSIHLHECQQLTRDKGETVKKPFGVYPYGYFDICSYCLLAYRDGDIDND